MGLLNYHHLRLGRRLWGSVPLRTPLGLLVGFRERYLHGEILHYEMFGFSF